MCLHSFRSTPLFFCFLRFISRLFLLFFLFFLPPADWFNKSQWAHFQLPFFALRTTSTLTREMEKINFPKSRLGPIRLSSINLQQQRKWHWKLLFPSFSCFFFFLCHSRTIRKIHNRKKKKVHRKIFHGFVIKMSQKNWIVNFKTTKINISSFVLHQLLLLSSHLCFAINNQDRWMSWWTAGD